jgi:hypothetical protein
MRLKGFSILLFFLASFIIGSAQDPSAKPTRSEIFDRMEARAQSLAKRMQEMSGKESQLPVEANPNVQTPVSSSSNLPLNSSNTEVVQEQKSGSFPAQNTDVSESRSPEPSGGSFYVVDDSDDYLPIESAQGLLGDYYISPSLGFVLSSESKVTYKLGSSMEVKDLDNEMGYGVGMKAGIRFENFFTEFGIRYSSLDCKIYGSVPSSGGLYTGDGTIDVLNFNARLGYTFPINELISFNGSVGLGLTNRKNVIDNYLDNSNFFISSVSSSETVLSYDLAFSISYFMAESYLISLGYNYMNVGKISQFDALNLHYFELGLGLNF